jgi:hypothetical protein
MQQAHRELLETTPYEADADPNDDTELDDQTETESRRLRTPAAAKGKPAPKTRPRRTTTVIDAVPEPIDFQIPQVAGVRRSRDKQV